jgi:hypothetical protein
MAAASDYSDLFANSELSDVNIVLTEHTEQPNVQEQLIHPGSPHTGAQQGSPASSTPCGTASSSDMQQRKQIPGHSVVVYVCSSFCKAKLQHWRSSNSSGKMEICIPVPAGGCCNI